VEKGRASARAGRLLDRNELVARIEKRYRTWCTFGGQRTRPTILSASPLRLLSPRCMAI